MFWLELIQLVSVYLSESPVVMAILTLGLLGIHPWFAHQ